PQVAPGTLSVRRGGFTLEENYGIAWAEEGDWFNYTRTFTNGNYHIYAAQSHGDGAGTPNRLRLRFGIVSGGGDAQVVDQFGAYQAPATGEFGLDVLNQVM